MDLAGRNGDFPAASESAVTMTEVPEVSEMPTTSAHSTGISMQSVGYGDDETTEKLEEMSQPDQMEVGGAGDASVQEADVNMMPQAGGDVIFPRHEGIDPSSIPDESPVEVTPQALLKLEQDLLQTQAVPAPEPVTVAVLAPATSETKLSLCAECDMPLPPELEEANEVDSELVARMTQHILAYIKALSEKCSGSRVAQACLDRLAETAKYFYKVLQDADGQMEGENGGVRRGRGRPRKPDSQLARPRRARGRGKRHNDSDEDWHINKPKKPALKLVLKTKPVAQPAAQMTVEKTTAVKPEPSSQEQKLSAVAPDVKPAVVKEKRGRGRPRKGEAVVKPPGSPKEPSRRGRPPKYSRGLSEEKLSERRRQEQADEEQLARLEAERAKEPPWECHMCHKQHLSEQMLILHIRQIHGLLRNFRCQYCDKGFKRGYSRNAHERSLVCVRTERSYKPRNLMRTHLCSACGNSFATSAALKAHFSTMHTTEAPYKCDICGKRFKLLGKLNQHIKFHSEDKPYMCELCSQSFKNKRYLQRHMNSGIHSGTRNFKCERCGRKFFLKKTLAQHMRIHADRKRYGCGRCEFRSNWRVYVTQHWKKCHPDAGAEPVVDLYSTAPPRLQGPTADQYPDGFSVEQPAVVHQPQLIAQQHITAEPNELIDYAGQSQLIKAEQHHEPVLDLTTYRAPQQHFEMVSRLALADPAQPYSLAEVAAAGVTKPEEPPDTPTSTAAITSATDLHWP